MGMSIKVEIFEESIPEHYVSESDISITMKCKPSNKWKLDVLRRTIESIEGWEFIKETTNDQP